MTTDIKDKSFIEVDGHVLIKDVATGEILLDKHNAINFENMSYAISNLLTGNLDPSSNPYSIGYLAFGNDGATLGSAGTIVYKTPNVDTVESQLYRETYRKSVTNDPETDPNNTMTVEHTPGTNYSDIIIKSTLDYNEPDGSQTGPYAGISQNAIDNGTSPEAPFVFDELGIVLETGKFISHIIFHPIEKSANRKIQVIYTLRIRAGN